MSLAQVIKPTLQFPFNGSNVDSISGISPTSQLSPGLTQIQGSAALVSNAPTSNTAMYFPGSAGSYMLLNSTPATFDLTSSSLFVEAWVYFNSFATDYQCVVANGPTNLGLSQECWILGLDVTPKPRFIVGGTQVISSTTLTVSTWYHIAGSYNSGTGTAYIFVNGGIPNSVSSITPRSSSGASLTIGAYPSPISGKYMNGYIQDLRVFKGGTVPTTSFTPVLPPFSNPPMPYSFPNSLNIVVYTLRSQFITYIPGIYNQAINFPNSVYTGNTYVAATTSVTVPISINSTPGFTISLWVKFNTNSIFAQIVLNAGGGANILFLDYYNILQYYDGTSGTLFPTSTVNIGTWYNPVIVVSGTTVTLYLNGNSSVGTTSFTTSSSLLIGAGNGDSAGGFPAWCSVQDLRIYNTPLGPLQIKGLYANGGAPANPPSTTMTNSLTPTDNIKFTGAPLLSQLSPQAQSSAAGIFSLRAVNGVTARAVNVVKGLIVQWPPVSMTSNATAVTGQTYGNGTYYATEPTNQSNTSPTPAFTLFDNNINTFYEQNYDSPSKGSNYFYNSVDGSLTGASGPIPSTIISTASVAGWWVQLQAPTSFTLRNYRIVGRQAGTENWWTNRSPSTFWIAGSNDGSTWSNVHFQSGITYYEQLGNSFIVPATSNSLPYSYYRMVVSKLNGNQGILNIASWILFGDSPSYTASSDFYADRLGNLLTAPVTGQRLSDWLGGVSGYVTTWYDQSRKGRDATQTTPSNQPLITLDASNRYQVDFTSNVGTCWMNLQNGTIPMQTAYTVTCHHNTIGNVKGGICGAGGEATGNANKFRKSEYYPGYVNYWWTIDVETYTGYAPGNVVTYKFTADTSPTSGITHIYTNGTEITGGNIIGSSRSGWVGVSGSEVIGSTVPRVAVENMNGQMYSLFLFTSALSDSDRIAVENAS